MGSSFEQAVKGEFLDRMPEILHDELPKVQTELGNYWSVTPGSQILWTTAVSNVLNNDRYGNASGDLKNLLLGKYGPFPFYRPADWIYEKIFGADWKKTLEEEGGVDDIEDITIDTERKNLETRLGQPVTDQQLVTYLQHPNDAVDFFKFEQEYGQTYVLPPGIFLRRGGFKLGETLQFRDHDGKEHVIVVGPRQNSEDGEECTVYLNVDHNQRKYIFQEDVKESKNGIVTLSREEIVKLAKSGDIRAPFAGNVCEIIVKKGNAVKSGDRLIILEAMKMQTAIVCEVNGTVESLDVKLGDTVKPGDKLLQITEPE